MTYVVLALFLLAAGLEGEGLRSEFGINGLGKIVYDGVTLMDSTVDGEDAFAIGEYRLIGRDGVEQRQWGENNVTRSWAPSTATVTWSYAWGKVAATYRQSGQTLTTSIVVSNTDKNITVEGLNIFPFCLNFPRMPDGFVALNYPQIRFGTDGPGVTVANYGSGMVAVVNEGDAESLYTGFSSTGTLRYRVLVGSTYNSGQPTFWPKNRRPIPAGGSDTYTVSLRFAPSSARPENLAGDTFQRYRAVRPYLVKWPDRRPIAAMFLSSSGTGDIHHKAGFPTNPRRYFNDAAVVVNTPAGLLSFQRRVLSLADSSIKRIKSVGGQGMITWDIEGQEYPQETSYVCDPQKLAEVAPEMESVIPAGSRYSGMKLADAFFKLFSDADLRTGVCIRPQDFSALPDGTASQAYLDKGLTDQREIDAKIAAKLIQKIEYAKNRWGVSIVYVDSAVNENRGPLNASVFRTVLQAFPDILIIPEEKTPAHSAYAAPWSQPSGGGFVRTPAEYRLVYPQAFSVIYVADAPIDKSNRNLSHYADYVLGVESGDILLFRGFFDDSYFNSQVKKIYADAAVTGRMAKWRAKTGESYRLLLLGAACLLVVSLTGGSYLAGWIGSRSAQRAKKEIEDGRTS